MTLEDAGGNSATAPFSVSGQTILIDLSGQDRERKITSGTMTGTVGGRTLTFRAGSSAFTTEKSYSLLEFLGLSGVNSANYQTLSVGGLRAILNSFPLYQSVWVERNGAWPGDITVSDAAHTATVAGTLTASGYEGAVACTLVLQWQ